MTRLRRYLIVALTACLMPLLCTFAEDGATNETATIEETSAGPVYVIPIHDMIEPALLFVIRRGVIEAENASAQAIVFTMDTPGGRLDATREIVNILLGVSVPTYTFVEASAYSAGAIISLATDHIYMAPGSVIGDAMPIMVGQGGGAEEMPENLQEKMVSGTAALIRTTAQEKGHDDELAECMVRREKEYKIGKEVICKEGELLTLTNEEAERLVGKGKKERKLLSSGTVKDIETLISQVGIKGAEIVRLEVTRAEHIARFIVTLSPFLFMGGLLGIYTEIKTPGFGIPGILGIICLALFFWGHNIAGLAGAEDVVLFAIGVGLLLAEVFVIPGFGVAGVAGLIIIFWALIKAMVQHYPGSPIMPTYQQLETPIQNLAIGIILTAVGAAIVARFLPQMPLFNRLILNEATTREQGYLGSPSADALLGLTGEAATELRPSGSAFFDAQKVDVVTLGDFIEKGSKIRVVDTHGNRVVVEKESEDAG